MISGARYSGVPHNVQVLPFTLLANPKSVTCTAHSGQDRGVNSADSGAASSIHSLPGAAAHLNVAVVVDEEVLGFQISVYKI